MLRPSGEAMAEIITHPVGIDRCKGALHILFALTLMELGKFEWRRPNDHEWEVGRWPGVELTLLAEPLWRSDRVSFAICPFPGHDGGVPFILLIAFQHEIESSDSVIGDTSVSVTTLTRVDAQRDVRICAHRAFDAALWLQLPYLEARHIRLSRPMLPNLPCTNSIVQIQARFTAPTTPIDIGHHPSNPIV